MIEFNEEFKKNFDKLNEEYINSLIDASNKFIIINNLNDNDKLAFNLVFNGAIRFLFVAVHNLINRAIVYDKERILETFNNQLIKFMKKLRENISNKVEKT